jgi:endonuclease/exonuclease/phosphatase family metal-dependent hydrolase
MTFNTLCDFCTKKTNDSFPKRIKQITKVVATHKADLISLQEIRTGQQAREIFSNLPNYSVHFYANPFISYADATIAVNTQKFKVLEMGHKWLNPTGSAFGLGWKSALPRIVVYSVVKERKTNKKFIFIGSHFDNRIENMMGSASIVNNLIDEKAMPVIFAADTNATVDFRGYHNLVKSRLTNSFLARDRGIASSSSADLCYLRKGNIFPACRVDHILYSKNSIFKPISWKIDTSRFGANKRFPSDHRPVIANFTLID